MYNFLLREDSQKLKFLFHVQNPTLRVKLTEFTDYTLRLEDDLYLDKQKFTSNFKTFVNVYRVFE